MNKNRENIIKHLNSLPKCTYNLPHTYIINLKEDVKKINNKLEELDNNIKTILDILKNKK